MEKFLTGDIWNEINRLSRDQEEKIAAIAYVTSKQLWLSKGDILICDASFSSIQSGQTSAKILEHYYMMGVKLFSNDQLHSKLMLTKKFLVIGSANLSINSAKNLIESAVITYNDILMSQVKAFCYSLMEESHALSRKGINSLLKIEVSKQFIKPKMRSKTRRKIFGDKYWFISALTLEDSVYEKIRKTIEIATTELSLRDNILEEHIVFLRWKLKTTFSKTVKEGDQIIVKYTNANKTRTYIYPPSTILKKQVKDGFVYLYYYENEYSEKNRINWTRFTSLIEGMELKHLLNNRSKTISEIEISKLRTFWKYE
jgi:hypothetical protein